ncbi:MAG: UDP-N-acetylmuramoyl-L-alanyl-D-glutamate--2,6-diaminopimelate ligase [Oscillospiraceae bacterium]|nr:UDP-N-acetylmuramoyl-L-alanyl-D-glutamate--2,6-diaminopimelate ligase [Oscillospiraceae bacterium]
MKLSALLAGLAPLEQTAGNDLEITSISYSSSEVAPGALFAAISGYLADGHRFIGEAAARGAAAVLCETVPADGTPYILVENVRAALAVLSANFYGHPSKKMTIIGVTGTNGKTTTTYLLKAMLENAAKAKVGLIGTNQNMIGDRVLHTERTTPESLDLQCLFAQMLQEGCSHVVMEVSSHALSLNRVDGVYFERAIFTNLTRDHLDFHKTMEDYRAAKGRIFQQCGMAVLNLDDKAGQYYAETVDCPVITYSENKDRADLVAKNIRLFSSRVEFEAVAIGTIGRIELPIPGGFTIYNALGVISCGLSLGLDLSDISEALKKAGGVKGRIEVVPAGEEFTVLIDYAHTPDALENILMTVRGFTKGRVLLLFGCGGDRDKSKRPLMGEIAVDMADYAVVTSDNPRTEDPEAIIQDILAGMGKGRASYEVEPDRRMAIRRILDLARPSDVVVLAGKGHETYQIVGHESLHLDEREEVADWVSKKYKKKSG